MRRVRGDRVSQGAPRSAHGSVHLTAGRSPPAQRPCLPSPCPRAAERTNRGVYGTIYGGLPSSARPSPAAEGRRRARCPQPSPAPVPAGQQGRRARPRSPYVLGGERRDAPDEAAEPGGGRYPAGATSAARAGTRVMLPQQPGQGAQSPLHHVAHAGPSAPGRDGPGRPLPGRAGGGAGCEGRQGRARRSRSPGPARCPGWAGRWSWSSALAVGLVLRGGESVLCFPERAGLPWG